MRVWLLWILVLQTLHLPVPFPDLDGECRGMPIQSLTDACAWHVLILGVCPNKDVDRGPFRTDEQNEGTSPVGSPFGQPGTNLNSASEATQILGGPILPAFQPISLLPHDRVDPAFGSRRSQTEHERSLSSRVNCALSCVWLI